MWNEMRRHLGTLVVLVLAARPACASDGIRAVPETPPPAAQINGYAAQGFVLSEGNNLNGTSRDDSGSARYQEFGVNASWQARSDVLLSGQLASMRAGAATDEYLLLEYALVDYTPWQGASGRGGLRAGKLKLPIGFYNESRDAVFTRPGILLPQGVYLDSSGAREFGYFSAWGASIHGDHYLGDHALYLEAGAYPRQPLGDNADIAILRTPASGDFEVDQGFLLRIGDDYGGGRLRTALSLLKVEVDYEAGPGTFPSNTFGRDGSLDFEQAVLSLQYNWPRFSLTSEFVARNFDLDELVSPNPFGISSEVDLTPIGGYVQGTWRLTSRSSAFLRYDEQIRDSGDRHGYEQARRSKAIEQATLGLIPAQPRHYYFAHDWTVGARHDLTDRLSVWGEFHYVDGVAWVNPLDNPGFRNGNAERYWNLFAVMLGYRF